MHNPTIYKCHAQPVGAVHPRLLRVEQRQKIKSFLYVSVEFGN